MLLASGEEKEISLALALPEQKLAFFPSVLHGKLLLLDPVACGPPYTSP